MRQRMPANIDFKALFDASPNPYMLLDRDLRYVAANRAYLRATASRLEDLLGRRIEDAFPHDPHDPNNENTRRLLASFAKVFATGEPDVLPVIPYRILVTKPEGPLYEEHYWSATHTPIRDETGKVAFILQHTMRVTDLQQRNAAPQTGSAPREIDVPSAHMETSVLERANIVQQQNLTLDAEIQHLRRVFAQAPGFMCVLRGREHIFELANAAYYQVVGHRDILGKPIREALPEVAGQGFFELLDRVFDTREPFVGRGMLLQIQRTAGAPLEDVFVDFVYQPSSSRAAR